MAEKRLTDPAGEIAIPPRYDNFPLKLANPAPLGLSGFALTTWLLSMINAGWFDATSMPLVFAMAFAFGGTAQFCAGLLELPRANTFGFTAFCTSPSSAARRKPLSSGGTCLSGASLPS